jgi:putative tricarboxylic transport membrane protein
MKNNDQRSSLIWLIIGLAIVGYSTKYGLGMLSSPGPGFVPFLAGLVLAALALVVFLQQLGKKRGERVKDLFHQKDWPAMLKVMGALVLYAVFLKSLGFILVTFCLTAYLFRVIEPMGWKKVFAGAFLTALGAYVVFDLWLEAQLPAGMFGF